VAGATGPSDPSGLLLRAQASAQVFVADPHQPEVESDDLHHLARVLRLRRDAAVVASDGVGHWALCRFGGPDSGPGDALTVDGAVTFEARLRPAVGVAFAPVKGDRPEWVVQKLTELGVDRIVPMETERSVVRWRGEKADHAVDRLRRITVEAAAQSRQVWLPQVDALVGLGALASVVKSDPDLLSVSPVSLAQMGGSRPTSHIRLIAIGPEGGFSPEELAQGSDQGYGTVGFGGGVLRAETAAVAAGVLLTQLRAGTVAEMGDY
jgi:16S rRNA (uracil1498-N3)-methyltransferase